MIESMIAERMGRLGTETAFEVLARARALERQGKSVVHLEIGEPDFDTPAHIREAAKRALDAGATHYGPSAGLPELREAIAEHIEKTRGVPVAPDDVGRIAELARHYRVPVLSDEIYRRFLYEGEFASIASLPGMKPQTVILDGFSKSYAMTGWRLGFGVMPKPLAEHLIRLMTNSVSCTATFIQHAGLAALRGDDTPVQAMVEEFRQRRDLVVDGLNRIPGVTCRRPRGAFYVFPNVKAIGRPSKEIATHLLEQAGVAVLGGTAFGEYGEGYLRLSYAASRETIQEALGRIERGLMGLG